MLVNSLCRQSPQLELDVMQRKTEVVSLILNNIYETHKAIIHDQVLYKGDRRGELFSLLKQRGSYKSLLGGNSPSNPLIILLRMWTSIWVSSRLYNESLIH